MEVYFNLCLKFWVYIEKENLQVNLCISSLGLPPPNRNYAFLGLTPHKGGGMLVLRIMLSILTFC